MTENKSAATSHSTVASPADYVGLTRSALDLINSTNPVNKLAHNIVRWLGRECINESDFAYCVERSRALAYPNEYGLEIRESIIKSEVRIARVGGLQLITSGAIGRWMAFSQDHAYMVTTVAAATKYQQIDFATKLLCEMILADKDGILNEEENYYSYSVDRARLMGVLSKFVDSILLNVVNAGHTLGDLPAELKSLCVHLVDAATFARIILKISRSNTDVLLLCDRFQGDLLLWILAHFEGSIEVSVAGKQAFQRASHHGKRRFTMMIKTVCQGEDCRKTSHSVELSELLEGTWIRTLNGRDDCTRKVSTGHRLPLYTTEPPYYSRQRDILNREELFKVRILAQRIISWLLDIPLKNNYDFTTIGFEAEFSSESAKDQMRIGDILYRWPRMLHDLSVRSSGAITPIVFIPPKPKESQGSGVLYEPDVQPLSELCECFPALGDLLKEILNRCNCRICRNEGVIDDCKEGCLCDAALSHLFMLIGNAIADGFGVQEASGIIPLDDYVYEVRKLLSNLVEGTVWWDDWFNVAASTALGYSPKGVLGDGYLSEGGNAHVAVQYGSSVVAAKWLDLTKKIRAHQCFTLEMAEGQIPGVQDRCVFILSEIKMELQCDLGKARRRLPDDIYEVWLREISETDQSHVTLQHAIIGSQASYSSRLITIISTGTSQRIIDPADAVAGVLRSCFVNPAKLHCQHSRDLAWRGNAAPGDLAEAEDPANAEDLANVEDPAEASYVWSFDDLLTSWEIENHGTFFTKSLNTELKVNVALSLSAKGCVLKETSTCLLCALETLESHPSDFRRRIISYEMDKQALVRR